MYHSIIALSFASASIAAPLAARDNTYPITADALNCRTGPGTSHSVVKAYYGSLTLACQTTGESIRGDNLWGKTTDGCYVADYYVSTGTADYVVDKCGGGGGGDNTYPITADALNCRTGPGTSHSVVKTYTDSLTLTCQTTGQSIRGDNLWGKTSDGCYVADYYVSTGTADYVVDKCSGGGGGGSDSSGGADLPGLTSTQSSHAQAIINEAKSEGLGHHGCLAGIATALQESSLLIYANSNVPESLNYPHDKVGHDYDSVGLFQQRVKYYHDIAADMDPARSAAQFFEKMVKVDGWKSMDVPKLCQTVQRSAYPGAYEKRMDLAEEVCSTGGL